MRLDRRFLGFSIAVSVLVHVIWLSSAPTPRARQTRAESLVEFSMEAPAPPAAPPPPAPEPPAEVKEAPKPEPPATKVARATQPVKRREPTALAPPPDEPKAEPAPAPALSEESAAVTLPASPPPSAAPAPAASTFDLSPLAAAHALRIEAPSNDHAKTCNPREVGPGAHCDDSAQATAAAAEQSLDQGLRQIAKTPAYLAKREPPRLTHAADGSYVYVHTASGGNVVIFNARITPDGEVRFNDAGNVQMATIPVGGTFDINDALMGGQLYSAEKRWFLEHTAELRHQLADAARSIEGTRAHVALKRAFEDILRKSITSQQKREAVFELWQDCSNDADALAVRSWLEALIRQRMPKGSELGFDDAYLEQHNRGLPAKYHFDPYRGTSAG